jgi:hypothetical protein
MRVESKRTVAMSRCVLIRHACVGLFFETAAAGMCLGLDVYFNKVIQHPAYQNHTNECKNHTNCVKITQSVSKLHSCLWYNQY